MKRIRLFVAFAIFSTALLCSQVTVPQLIITEVYGGGGNAGALYNQDFVEFYNPGAEAVSLSGWSLQYYTSTGTTPSKSIEFSSTATVQPFGYFLLAASGGDVGSQLPGKDFEVVASFSLSSGKMILFKTIEKQTFTTLEELKSNVNLVDYLPYGKAAVPILGTAMERDCSSVLSASRKKDANNVFLYSANTGADFELVAPNPVYSGLRTQLEPLTLKELYVQGKMLFVRSSENTVLNVYNMRGELVLSKANCKEQHEFYIETPGIYLVKFGDLTRKIIIFEN